MSNLSDIPPDGPDRRHLGEAASTDSLHDLFDPISASILVVDRDQRIVSTNLLFDDSLGISRGTVLGKPGKEVLRCGMFPRNGAGCSANGSRCVACEVWEVARLAASENEVKKSSIGVEVEVEDTVHSLLIELRATALRMGGERFTILALEGLDRVRDYELWADERGLHGILGTDLKMFELFETICRVARTRVPVLIQGESGSGKDMVAEALHRESPRRDGPMVPVNCGALPTGLIESELFGHVKGAFTGAIRHKPGRFELARGGTIFLDEIGELSAEMQVKLLRVLQDGTYERVGGEESVKTDARFISATNLDLDKAIVTGSFRPDLFYRLSVVPVRVPPLRERSQDVTLLARHLLRKAAKEYDKETPELSPSLNEVLLAYPWPGNVRELDNAVRHALIRSNGSRLKPEHLPKSIVRFARNRKVVPERAGVLDDVVVARALRQAEGNKVAAARLLGVSRATLYRFLAELERRGGQRG